MLTQDRLEEFWFLWSKSSKVERFGQFVCNRANDPDILDTFYRVDHNEVYDELLQWIMFRDNA